MVVGDGVGFKNKNNHKIKYSFSTYCEPGIVLTVWHTDSQMLLLITLGCRFSLSLCYRYGHIIVACFLNLPRSHNLVAGPSMQPAYYPDLLQSK